MSEDSESQTDFFYGERVRGSGELRSRLPRSRFVSEKEKKNFLHICFFFAVWLSVGEIFLFWRLGKFGQNVGGDL